MTSTTIEEQIDELLEKLYNASLNTAYTTQHQGIGQTSGFITLRQNALNGVPSSEKGAFLMSLCYNTRMKAARNSNITSPALPSSFAGLFVLEDSYV